MPTYRIETNRGTFDIESNREPTQSEIESYVASSGSGVVAENQPPNVSDRYQSSFNPSGISAGYAPIPDAGVRQKLASNTARYGPVIAAGIAAPTTLLHTLGTIPTIAAISELAGRFIENKPLTDREALSESFKAFATSANPAGTLVKAPGAMRTAYRMGEGAAKVAIPSAIGEVGRRSIEGGEVKGYGSLLDAVKDLALPTIAGGTFSTIGEVGRKMTSGGITRTKRLAELEEGGIVNPTLDLIFPGRAGFVNRVAQHNKDVAQLRIDSTRPLFTQFEDLAKGAPEHETIYKQLRPYLDKIDNSRLEVRKAEQTAVDLRGRALLAAKDAQATPEMIALAKNEASVAELNAINSKARMLHEANADLSGYLDYDAMAKEFRNNVESLFQFRKNKGGELFNAAGVPNDAPIFSKNEFLKVAEKALSRVPNTDTKASILNTIRQVGNTVDDEGKPVVATAMNLAQFRELRSHLSDAFTSADPLQRKAYEGASASVYGALSDVSKDTIAKLPGANIDAYNAAVAYWRETAESAANRFAKPLLSKEASRSTFQTLAKDLVDGNPSEIRSYNEFVDSITKDAPDVAKAARQELTKAIRNDFLGRSMTAANVDTKSLTNSLLMAQKKSGLDIGALGFGSADDIQAWQKTFDEFNLKNVAAADLEWIFANPKVQQALAGGKPLTTALRPEIARLAFEDNVGRQMLETLAGKTAKARATAAEAEKLADAAGISLAERKAILSDVESDPIAQAFTGGRKWGIPTEPGSGGVKRRNAITKTLLNLEEQDGVAFMRALREKSPSLHEQMVRRIGADVITGFWRPAQTEGHVWALDKSKTERFFSPGKGSPEEFQTSKIRAFVGPETFSEMERIVKAVTLVHDVEKAGGILSTDGSKAILTSSKLGRGIGAGVPTYRITLGLRHLLDFVENGYYNTLMAVAKKGEFADKFWELGGDVGRMMDSMTPQRMVALMRDADLKSELEEIKRGGRPPKPTEPIVPPVTPTPPAPPAPLSQFKPGIYRDRITGATRRFDGTQFV